MKLYLKVTRDKYELPVAVADTQAELARMCGVSLSSIASALCLMRQGVYKRPIYREVEVDDELV